MNTPLSSRVTGSMTLRKTIFALLFALAACKPAFDPKVYPTTDKLYDAAIAKYKAHNWEDAAKAFEKLTTDMGIRDPRLPSVYYYLGESQQNQGLHLLAATTFNRLVDAFPQDTLVDDALFLSGRSYEKLWRKPALDPQYGQSAITAYESLLSVSPDGPYAARAKNSISKLDNWLAIKDYDTGYLYLKRKAYDSAIIYFKDVIRLHPNAPKSREAYLRLLEAYRAIKYADDARDTCDAMRKAYPTDREVREACGAAPVVAAPNPGQ
jgi:outer membrane assembly lipoprotein YfiO